MISTPYFDNLQKIADRTSKIRKDNYALGRSLSRLGFSDFEVIQITETENFLRFRPSPKKTCSSCGVEKDKQRFPKWLNNGYEISICKVCTKKITKDNYEYSQQVKDKRQEVNKGRPTTELKRRFKIYD
jgi:hypothetical protein